MTASLCRQSHDREGGFGSQRPKPILRRIGCPEGLGTASVPVAVEAFVTSLAGGYVAWAMAPPSLAVRCGQVERPTAR